MISNLPLLFAGGQPTCLEKISVSQLEKFIPFMIQCSCGQSDAQKLTAPPWWPSSLNFSIPLIKPPEMEGKWLQILKNLVYSCYSFHKCEFMLRFCSDLSRLSISQLQYVTSWDGTTSLYNKLNGKLLVTFRNENLFYDNKKSSPKKTLLCRSNAGKGERHGMVQPPQYDVYLCDNCDEEFSTLKEVQTHEKNCCRQEREPSPPCASEEVTKQSFLEYFKLADAKSGNIRKTSDPPLRKQGYRSSLRFSTVPISSPLGKALYKKTKLSPSTSAVHLDRIERYCPAKPSTAHAINRQRGCAAWPVSWKPRKKGEEDESDWVHVYKKPGRPGRKTNTVVKNKSSFKTQKLLLQCRNVKVRVKKLTPHEISLYTSNRNSRRASVDLSTEQSKCVSTLISRRSTNSIQLSCRKIPKSGSEDCSKKHERVLKSLLKDTFVNRLNTNGLDSCKSNIRLEQKRLQGKNSEGSEDSSKQHNDHVFKSLIRDTLVNGLNINELDSCNSNVSFEQKSPQGKKSMKLEKQFSLSSFISYNQSDLEPILPQELVSNSASCEVTCIPVIDLVSSDEECESV